MDNPLSRGVWNALAIVVGLLVLLLAVRQVTGITRDAKDLRKPSEHSITISAQGKASAKPDVAKIQLTVLSEGPSAPEVTRLGTKKYNDLVAALQKLGLKSDEIRTTNYSLNPRYRYEPASGKQSVDGYELRQGVEVKLRDLAKMGQVIADATAAGANQIDGMQMDIDDPEKTLVEAREKALANAKDKAAQIANATGAELGPIVNYSESNWDVPPHPPVFYERALGTGGDAAMPVPDIQAGNQELTLTVTVTFSLKD